MPHETSINDLVEHIYCINLDRRPDRWAMAEKEFEKAGIRDVERFVATDGKTMPKGKLKPGELGVTNSVMRVFRDAVQKNYSSILILEDDVEFAPTMSLSLSWAPEDWEILHFGGSHARGKPKKINAKIAIPNKTLSAYAIAFKGTTYTKLLSLLNYDEQVDVTYANNWHQFKSYVFTPPIAGVKPIYSDIQEGFYDHPDLRRYDTDYWA
jgi:hypothetical protein